MAKMYMIVLLACVVVVHATARNIPNDETKKLSDHENTQAGNPSATIALAPVQNGEKVVSTTAANAPAANGIDDQKNFITYGGVGGWAGIGGFAGVVPVLGGIGGGSGLGGLGGVGGLGGLGGGTGGLGGVGSGPGLSGRVGGPKGGIVP